tara:strand:+ start:39433 stop:40377 length:945 start_codon:yes stop_codon:yes gene_type:complete
MSFIKLIIVSACVLFLGCNSNKKVKEELIKESPKIAFTFDDGSTKDLPNYQLEEWNQLILRHLKKNDLKAVLFATGSFLEGEKGKYVLNSWNDAGHKIANHTYSHPYYHSSKVTINDFEKELLKNDSIIKNYSNYYRYFRYPYLKEGNSEAKRDSFRAFLKNQNYKVGHVTIDASDWYVSSRLTKRLKENPEADISGYRDYYIDHIYNRALFYDSLAAQLTNRKIKHTLLLHHNLTSALFLDDLIKHFKSKGWEVVNADEAFNDQIYNEHPKTLPAGESLIWSLAKQTGKYDSILRYPPEDSQYEKDNMDILGL